MKITRQDKEFRPITIVLETEVEVALLYQYINIKSYDDNVVAKGIFDQLFDNDIMSNERAVEILTGDE